MNMVIGTQLTPNEQREALRRYVHRYTREHKPDWARKEWKDGLPYPLQFDSDKDWLNNTEFAVKADGTLDGKAKYCSSRPTWPDNPELRRCN